VLLSLQTFLLIACGALAHRVNAGEGGVVIFPGIFGSPTDSSAPMEDRDMAQLGQRTVEPDADRHDPLVEEPPSARVGRRALIASEARVNASWSEHGLGAL
jgi:hypothetical protein